MNQERTRPAAWLSRLLPAGLILLGAMTGAMAQKPAYEGSARLYSLDYVTVVYPAGAGQDVEANRRSAERRAAYLWREFDVRAEIAPDDGVTDEQLHGDLLLLGWDNRLLDPPDKPSLFSESEGRRRFLGAIWVGEKEDLTFGVVSPYNPERNLIFWSRIDTERDRFLVLPFVGSDFAVYQDYGVVHQGMFANRYSWPPLRNPDAEMAHRGLNPHALKVRATSEHYEFRGVIDVKEAAEILQKREEALSRVTASLGALPADFRIALFVYKDQEDKEAKTGVPDPAHSIPSRREAFMTLSMARSKNLREEAHIVATEKFGVCGTTAMFDGLAVALDLPADVEGLPLYAAMIVEHGELPAVRDLLDEESLRGLTRRRVGMAAAGLLARWIRETGGDALLARAFGAEELDPNRLAEWMGRSPTEVETAFRSWVSMLASTAQGEMAFQKNIAEARRLRGEGNPSAAADSLSKALMHKPDDPETLYKLGLALIEAERLEGAERHLKRLVALPVGGADQHFVTFGYYQLGQLYERLEQPAEAERNYRTMLELPDRYESHRMAGEALEHLADGAGQGEGTDEGER